jgi:hypothetical protein
MSDPHATPDRAAITKRAAAIVTAYTGMMIGDFPDFHAYVEEILGRPVMTHEMADKKVWLDIKEAAKPDFVDIEVGP